MLGLRGRIQVVWGNFFDQDLSQASVVTCFLLQKTNDRLKSKLEQELCPGTRVVSNLFTFPEWPTAHWDSKNQLYMYKIKK